MGPEVVTVGLRERDLLLIARALVGGGSYETVASLLAAPSPLVKLSPPAMAILRTTLARGVVTTLARLGGARPRVRPLAGTAQPTRVYHARKLPPLVFGAFSFQLLRWLATEPLGERAIKPLAAEPKTLGDEILAYLALRLVDQTPVLRHLAESSAIRGSALAWLGFAGPLGEAGASEPEAQRVRFARLLDGEGAVLVESLEVDLTRRWVLATTRSHDVQVDAAVAGARASAERQTLEAFLDAASARGRWDLATFVAEATARVLAPGTPDMAKRLVPRFRPGATLRARAAVVHDAGALLRAFGRVAAERRRLGLVRFFEDGYDDAQATLASWESRGTDPAPLAADVVRELDTLDTLSHGEDH